MSVLELLPTLTEEGEGGVSTRLTLVLKKTERIGQEGFVHPTGRLNRDVRSGCVKV